MRFSLLLFLYTSLVAAQYTSSDWKSRDQWMKADALMGYANLQADDAVADVGCHEGYLTMHLAKRVGVQGKVYAVDINTSRLDKLKKHAKKRKFKNITTILGDYDDPKLPKNKLDVVFVVDTYHEMESYKKMLAHFYNALKSEGRIILLEKLKEHKIGASRSEQVSAHTLALGYVKKELQEAGFTIKKEVRNFGNWERDKTKKMWILIAQKPIN